MFSTHGGHSYYNLVRSGRMFIFLTCVFYIVWI